ncbi:hypothetical protein OLZ32_27355 [Rhizobium sp. 1AS11]|uniref:hypothetical protein n=1 Tax=Rhizobium acaciae TaxID=2989736 RepID=UPI00222304AF|nr:hypothetical protein [Rhizobium acaciae]MCW1411939.1 hypothetical protein [Rhizobium acaciae]MCW1744089.1 hypothetical protein [Rhizobium acaciae]
MLPLIGGRPAENIGVGDEVSDAHGAIPFRYIELAGDMLIAFGARFVGYDQSVLPLLGKADITTSLDEGTIALPVDKSVAGFVADPDKPRARGREPSVKLGKASPPVA